MGTAVASTIVAAQQRIADASHFSEATAVGSQQAFLLLAVMMLVAFAISYAVTKQRRKKPAT